MKKAHAQNDVAPPAKSDSYSVKADGEKERLQHRDLASANFRISGVDLASDEDVLLQATKVFGKTPIQSSGDAGTAEQEACYESADQDDNTQLTFGRGEVDSSFTLSADALQQKRVYLCTRSAKVKRDLATESGLHLGLNKEQLIAILGSATKETRNRDRRTETLIYVLEGKKRTDPRKLAMWWQEEIKKNPTANYQEFVENYAFYGLEIYISALFVEDSLTKLEFSWSGQY
ncbi:MAG TPA: hypothetical protein VFQ00_02445 [Terriglobales bacterium]|nr:hypothetical protein [Terriglobales bacterium]